MIPNQVFEQMATSGFDQAQLIIVMKMLNVTAEAARAQARAEMREELAAMRADFGRLIIEAVEATEAKILARLAEEKHLEEEKKRERREKLAARKREREGEKARLAATQEAEDLRQCQAELFVDDDRDLMNGFEALGNVAQEAVSGLAPMRAAHAGGEPVTAHLAAKFDDNPEYAALVAQWEERARRNEPVKPKGSPMAALQSLGDALIANAIKEEEAERQAAAASLATTQDMALLAHEGSDDGAVPQLLEAAE